MTLAAVLLLAQSVTAGLFLADLRAAFPVHRELATAAGVLLLLGIAAAVLCARLRRQGWAPMWATIGMVTLLSLQAFAGYRSLTALHVPLGVVTILLGVALAAWSWRSPRSSATVERGATATPASAG